ncbi:MAG: cyclic lactone autoinducer peptide [Oscillospiraceae bacterium]
MKFKKAVATALANISLAMAKKSCGVASMYGAYQPKQPTKLEELAK